jgi:DNA-binding GntR family transcriptional regulator
MLRAEAASTIDDSGLSVLRDLHDKLESASIAVMHFFAANEAFHLGLLAQAGNPWRLQIVLDLRKVMKLNRHTQLLKTGRPAQSLEEHRDSMVAIQNRDAEQARLLMQRHSREWPRGGRHVARA